jgi:formylglycine-generating enzyme required for sulfatase activity/predicted Ser/Thr protein kinase
MSSLSSFARSLRSLRSGQISQDELLAEIYRHLTIEKASPVALLKMLEAEQLAQPLRSEVHESILSCILNWPQDPTVLTSSPGAPSAARRPVVGVGDVLKGRFDLIELIGEGGMSRVFKAVDLRRMEAGAADPCVAVKILTGPVSEYFGSITALQREAHKLQSLSHRNVVRVMDCDRDGRTIFMTMEYLAGESLQKKLREGNGAAIDRSTAESVIIAIADALEYAHANGIVHGDLKPGNVIIATDGTVKVIDFGMARFVARPGGAQTQAEIRRDETTPKAVTPRYASPEMLAGHDPKPTDDVYALACIAYECLSGHDPFDLPRKRGDTDLGLRPPRPLDMPKHRYLALMKALEFDRKDRTASVRQFRAELMAMRRNLAKRWAWIGVAVVVLAVIAFYRLPWLHQLSSPLRVGAPAAPGTVIRDCPTCPLMIVLPVGYFTQGADNGDPDVLPFVQPSHAVVIGYPLAMSKHEVMVSEYREFAETTRREMSGCNTYDGEWQYQAAASWQAPGFSQGAAHPVACTSWNDAVAYAKWLSQKSGHTYRLPSASEWEYAARAGTGLTQPWAPNASGACVDANVADQSAAQRFPGWETFPCSDGYVSTAPVGSFKANAFGLNDLLGNVFEWVEDCWHPDYNGAPKDGSARLDGDCKEHELRGGSWFSSPRFVNASYRNRFETDYRSSAVGFRLVREIGR